MVSPGAVTVAVPRFGFVGLTAGGRVVILIAAVIFTYALLEQKNITQKPSADKICAFMKHGCYSHNRFGRSIQITPEMEVFQHTHGVPVADTLALDKQGYQYNRFLASSADLGFVVDQMLQACVKQITGALQNGALD